VSRYDDLRAGGLSRPDEVRFGSARAERRRRARWPVLAGAIALIAVIAAAATAFTNQPSAPAVVTITEAGHRLLGVTADWELFGYGPRYLVRVQFARGRITRTTLPAGSYDGPVSFVVGPAQAIIRPLDNVPGYLVPDGQPARSLPAALSDGGTANQGPRPGTAWVQAGAGTPAMSLVRLGSGQAGAVMRLPASSPWLVTSDGRGYVLLYGAGTVYDVRPAGFRRIAGSMAAVGPTRWLTVVCRDQLHCSNVVIDPASGASRRLPGPPTDPAWGPGVIAPDGSAAAVIKVSGTGHVTLHLINLGSGADQRIAVRLDQGSFSGQALAWSPDGKWLFAVAAHGRLVAVNARTRRAQGLGVALPAVSQIAITDSPR
jgi:hypothetical protein